jgi:hypothetical protein
LDAGRRVRYHVKFMVYPRDRRVVIETIRSEGEPRRDRDIFIK